MKLTETDKRQVIKFLPYLLVPMLLSIFSYGELLNLVAIASIYLGFRYRPEKIWPSWLAAVVLLWLTYGIATLFGVIPFEEGGETWWSFALEAFVFMALLVAIPMWLGRFIKHRMD